MKRQHLWGIVEQGELTPDTFLTRKDAQEDIKIHKEIEIYVNAKVVKLVMVNERKSKKRKRTDKQKKSRTAKRPRKV